MELYERGSEWRRWDLHIHTPGTNKNDQFNGENEDEKWERYYQDIRDYIGDASDDSKSIAVIGITDYLSIDNYKKVIMDNKLPDSVKLVLPNVEMRMTPVSGRSPINIHCIFSPDIIEDIDSLFFSRLVFEYNNRKFSATKEDIIKLGRTYRNDISLEENVAYKAGIEQFVVNQTTLKGVFDDSIQLRENTIIVVSNKGTDGASGTRAHKDYFEGDISALDATTQNIYRMADMIFSSNASDIEYFLGKRTDDENEIKRKCGSLKPCIHGSDAHSNEKIFKPDLNRYCWIKADPTFEGLKQVTFEPEQRVKISEYKPEEKQSYNVIDRVEFMDNDFQEEPVCFNANLNCIIGGKSTGKSILIQNLARTIDEAQTTKHLKTSKRLTKNDVNMKVFWKDGKSDNHKIVYIPQTYLNQLSEEKENQTEIDEWVEEILLKNINIKNSKVEFSKAINDYKMEISKKLLDFINLDNESKKITAEKLEIGNKDGIIAEISKLNSEKEKIIAQSELSEDEIKEYEYASNEIENTQKYKNILLLDKDNINAIEDLVIASTAIPSFSEKITDHISKFTEQLLVETKNKWDLEKIKIIKSIDFEISELEKKEAPLEECINKIKPKVESNATVKVLTNKISQENAKLAQICELEDLQKAILEKRNYLRDSLSNSADKYKHIYQIYAQIINNNTQESDGLIFCGETPFRSSMFCSKLYQIYDTRRSEFKEIIGDMEQFNEERYNAALLEKIIEKTLDGTMVLKSGYTIESALREILDDWYNIVYRVKMDEDPIEQMSPGKKALVLLKILISMAESKCPILIDQPEDDLDNRSIFTDLINFIKEKKIERQIIIVTHNANIVLGSDSENVIVANSRGTNSPNKSKKFEYRNGSIENNKLVYKEDGNTIEDGILNQRGIQQHICDILEGGEVAFEIRKKKYRI